jgi:hypothetical protein
LELLEDRWKTGIRKGEVRRKADSDEELAENSSSWDETDSEKEC